MHALFRLHLTTMCLLNLRLGLLLVVYLRSVCDWRDKIGHDDCSAEVLGAVWDHSLQTSTIPQVQVPVIRPADGQLLCRCRCRTTGLSNGALRWMSMSTCSKAVADKSRVPKCRASIRPVTPSWL
ncbi:hypothetical protein ABBQ38_008925 [Trebouxia sp. C0009 RCD-2024]